MNQDNIFGDNFEGEITALKVIKSNEENESWHKLTRFTIEALLKDNQIKFYSQSFARHVFANEILSFVKIDFGKQFVKIDFGKQVERILVLKEHFGIADEGGIVIAGIVMDTFAVNSMSDAGKVVEAKMTFSAKFTPQTHKKVADLLGEESVLLSLHKYQGELEFKKENE